MPPCRRNSLNRRGARSRPWFPRCVRRRSSVPAGCSCAPCRRVRASRSTAWSAVRHRWRSAISSSGRTPCRSRAPGRHQWSDSVTLTADRPSRTLEEALRASVPAPVAPKRAQATGVPRRAGSRRRASRLSFIASRPAGATVTIDGRPAGTTPLTVPSLGAGSHTVRINAPATGRGRRASRCRKACARAWPRRSWEAKRRNERDSRSRRRHVVQRRVGRRARRDRPAKSCSTRA